jgi:hypothetical protein
MTDVRVPSARLIVGDALTTLRGLGAGSVHTVITSPPYYGLRDYGQPGQLGLEETPDVYVARLVEVFSEVWRVLRPDGTLWVNMGDGYSAGGRGGNAQERGGTFHGNGYREEMAGRVKRPPPGFGPKQLLGMPWRLAFALQADGWVLRSDIVWHKCLSGGAMVYARTQKGEMPMMVKDMIRLDPVTVELWDGRKWNQVVSFDPSPRVGNEVEIELRNGARIGCTRDHRWPTTRGLVEAGDLRPGDVFESCRLPAPVSPRQPAGLPDEDIGWLVGLYIAEGSQSNGTIQIAGHADEAARLERVRRIVADYDGYCAFHRGKGNAATININSPTLLGVIRTYVAGRVAKDYHRPGRLPPAGVRAAPARPPIPSPALCWTRSPARARPAWRR